MTQHDHVLDTIRFRHYAVFVCGGCHGHMSAMGESSMRLSGFRRTLSVAVSASMVAGLALVSSPAASAAPGKIPDGGTDFYILGGRIAIGTAIDIKLPHADEPPECADGVDNEVGSTTHNGTTGTGSGATIRPVHDSADFQVDYVHPSGGTPDPECTNAADNSEFIDREIKKPDEAPACGTGAGQENAGEGGSVRCWNTSRFDSYVLPASGTTNNDTANRFSLIVGDGSASVGQAHTKTRATGGTVSGTSITVPQANVVFPAGYQAQGQCVAAFGLGQPGWVCLDLYIQFRVLIQGNVTGTTNANGSGSFGVPIRLNIIAGGSFGTAQKNTLIGRTPRASECRSASDVTVSATTETSGSLSGVRYDTTTKNFKAVQDAVSFPALTRIRANGTASDICPTIGSSLGLPTTGQIELIISTESDTTAVGSYQTGTGAGVITMTHPPVALGTAGAVNANEGDVVTLSSGDFNGYDPAMRALVTENLVNVSGAAPPAIKDNGNGTFSFVAQDAPGGGATSGFEANLCAHLGPVPEGDPGEQRQCSGLAATTVSIANVAPTADAGADEAITGGQPFTMKGKSSDPGDPESQRSYCWTRLSGPTVSGLGACPTGKAPTITPANTNGTLVMQLVVSDNDGGTSVADTVSLDVRASSAGTMSGEVTDQLAAPVSGADVNVYTKTGGTAGTLVASTTTNGSGQWSVSGLGAGPFKVRFTKSLYFNQWAGDSRWPSSSADVTTPQSNVDAVMATLGEGGSIGGNLTNAQTAAPAGSVLVRLFNSAGWVANDTSDGAGDYGWTAIPPGSAYRLNFAKGSATYLETWANGILGPNAGNEATTYGLIPSGSVVVDAALAPLAGGLGAIGGTVTASAGTFTGGQLEARVYRDSDGAYMGRDVLAASSATFAYSVGNLPPGNYRIWFWDRTGSFKSEWGSNLIGGQFDMTGKIADLVAVTAGGTTTVNETLAP